MNACLRSKRSAALCLALVASTLAPAFAFAHCDGLDGPVVAAARQALNTSDVKKVLIWVQTGDEPEITLAFSRTMAVRRFGPEARDLADRYFFETLVRVHRAGGGAPYTGLQPAGRDLGPAIPAADGALESADPHSILILVNDVLKDGLSERFARVLEAKRHAGEGVDAGRRYVAAYVQYIHYVEELYRIAASPTPGHFDDAPQARLHAH